MEGGLCDRLMQAVLEESELVVGEYVLQETKEKLDSHGFVPTFSVSSFAVPMINSLL